MESKKHARVPGGDTQAWLAGLNRAILDSALDCIISLRRMRVATSWNSIPRRSAFLASLGEEAAGKELAELIIPPSLRERHRQGLQRYLKTGEGAVLGCRIEINAVRTDGSEILVELAITSFRIQDKPIFTAYLRDITERKWGDDEASRRFAAVIESSEDLL